MLARHGASAAFVPGEPFPLSEGRGDPPLAPEGERQARALAARLAADAPSGLFVTTLQRTVQTAAPLVALTGLEPVVVRDLREVFLGDWDAGEYRVRLAQRDPTMVRVFEEERWELIPGAEPAKEFSERVRHGLAWVADRVAPGTTAVAILHAGVIAECCRQVTDSRPFAFAGAENASITRLMRLVDGRWRLRVFNDTAHLRG